VRYINSFSDINKIPCIKILKPGNYLEYGSVNEVLSAHAANGQTSNVICQKTTFVSAAVPILRTSAHTWHKYYYIQYSGHTIWLVKMLVKLTDGPNLWTCGGKGRAGERCDKTV
jgi:hypothetical protein